LTAFLLTLSVWGAVTADPVPRLDMVRLGMTPVEAREVLGNEIVSLELDGGFVWVVQGARGNLTICGDKVVAIEREVGDGLARFDELVSLEEIRRGAPTQVTPGSIAKALDYSVTWQGHEDAVTVSLEKEIGGRRIVQWRAHLSPGDPFQACRRLRPH
jgi:hypothetical protein